MRDAIFTDWTPDLTAAWGKAPLRARHRLNKHPLFSFDALAELIERYPRQHYALVYMGPQGGKREWREGDIGARPQSCDLCDYARVCRISQRRVSEEGG